MATIDERAKQYAKEEFLVSMSHSKTIEDIAIRAYSQGSVDQEQIDTKAKSDAIFNLYKMFLKESEQWLMEQNLTRGHYAFIKNFKEAMRDKMLEHGCY